MTTTFEEQLAKIKAQASVLENLDERAVELGVILPLLKQLGWDTEDLKQIYPQKPVPGAGKVDYDLRVGDESRVFIEVKRWGHSLNDEDEAQLRDYCLAGKPNLATLTNDREWQLYLPQLRHRPKGLGKFLDLDIIKEPEEAEQNLQRFLSRDMIRTKSAVGKTVKDAGVLLGERQSHAAVMNGLAEAWNELTTDKGVLARFVESLAKDRDIEPNKEQVEQFIRENETLVSLVSKPPKPKPLRPTSFSLQVNGEALKKPVQPKQWNVLLLEVCLLMQSRHPGDFEKKILEIPEVFSNSAGTLGWEGQVGDTGIYFRKGGAGYVKEVCYEVVSKFGYPRESLTIEEK